MEVVLTVLLNFSHTIAKTWQQLLRSVDFKFPEFPNQHAGSWLLGVEVHTVAEVEKHCFKQHQQRVASIFIKVSSIENFPHFQPIEFILLIFMCFFPLSFFNKQILVFKTMKAFCHTIFQCRIPVQGTMPCLLFLLQPLSPCTVQCSFPISLSGKSLEFFCTWYKSWNLLKFLSFFNWFIWPPVLQMQLRVANSLLKHFFNSRRIKAS